MVIHESCVFGFFVRDLGGFLSGTEVLCLVDDFAILNHSSEVRMDEDNKLKEITKQLKKHKSRKD